MGTTIPALSSVTDILDSDLVMITHSSGESFKIAGSEINKRNQAVIASGTTLTGAPLKTGNIVRVYFTVDITGSNTSTALTLNYNSVNYSVKVPKNGTLANFVASDLGGSPTVYKYLQAHTTLELLYDGTQFIIIENPVVISGSSFKIYADGSKLVNEVTSNNMNSVTSNAVFTQLYNKICVSESKVGTYTLNGGETKSFEITRHVPASPYGYSRFTSCYCTKQNYVLVSTQIIGNQVYVTMTNTFTSALEYDLYAFVLYFYMVKPVV